MWLIALAAVQGAVVILLRRLFDENADEDGVRKGDDWVFRAVRRVQISLFAGLILSAGLLADGLRRDSAEQPPVVLLGLYAVCASAALLAWPPSIILTPRGVVKKRWGLKGHTLPYRMISDFREDEDGGILISSVTGKQLRVSPLQAGLSQMLFLLRKRAKHGTR